MNRLLCASLCTIVIISPESFEKRNLIRSTWGNNSLAPEDFKVIFIIGLSTNSTINEVITEEFKLNKDILQINNLQMKILDLAQNAPIQNTGHYDRKDSRTWKLT